MCKWQQQKGTVFICFQWDSSGMRATAMLLNGSASPGDDGNNDEQNNDARDTADRQLGDHSRRAATITNGPTHETTAACRSRQLQGDVCHVAVAANCCVAAVRFAIRQRVGGNEHLRLGESSSR